MTCRTPLTSTPPPRRNPLRRTGEGVGGAWRSYGTETSRTGGVGYDGRYYVAGRSFARTVAVGTCKSSTRYGSNTG